MSFIVHPVTTDVYGSIEGVQAYLTMIRLTDTSKPSLTHAMQAMLTNARIINSRLNTAGYATPITDPESIELLADAENLLTAASLFERLIMSSDAMQSKTTVAGVWRQQAEDILDPILSGKSKMGSVRNSSAGGVANSPEICLDSDLEEFVDSHGGGGI